MKRIKLVIVKLVFMQGVRNKKSLLHKACLSK